MRIPNEPQSLFDDKILEKLRIWQPTEDFAKLVSEIDLITKTHDLLLKRENRDLQEAFCLRDLALAIGAKECRLCANEQWPDGKMRTPEGEIRFVEITEVMEPARRRDEEYRAAISSPENNRDIHVDQEKQKSNGERSIEWFVKRLKKKLDKNYTKKNPLDILIYDNISTFEDIDFNKLCTEVNSLFNVSSNKRVAVWRRTGTGVERVFPEAAQLNFIKDGDNMTLPNEPQITPDLIANHGLNEEEYQKILDLIGREPSYTELGIFSAMWNEHCSYKSSKKWLHTLPTKGKHVILGPGENAGVVDIGDGQAVIFKMESHNHPSYIEPYQGAATGIGGILRDVFTMGARPIAAMNALRFGEPDHHKTRHLVSGVVAGIGGYGNCFGVPTVGGEVEFNPRYNGNNLVNAFAAGLADTDKIFLSEAKGVGLPIVYLGAKTGRDGVGGATMASAEFDDDIEEKRPTVQVGDPFTEKRLMEATIELMGTGAVIAIQDMGAAGLTCSAVEMGAKGGLGVELNLDHVPVRETNMTPYEMMLSESQERMLMVLRPEKEAEARAVFEKWELDFATVGITTDDLRFRILWQGTEVANLPIKELGDEAPEYDRPWIATEPPIEPSRDLPQTDIADALLQLIGSPNLSSRRWVWEQYDTLIQGNSLQLPGGDAGVVRVDGHPSKALAFSSDVTPRYCEADPFEGGKQAVAECWRNLSATGAEPLACSDNLNFGNPEKPKIMGQLVGAIKGIGAACKALDFPIVSGNVSLYNETNGVGILPTPTMAGVGLLPDHTQMARIGFNAEDDAILLIGAPKEWGTHLSQSEYLSQIHSDHEGPPPPVDLASERKNGDFVRALIRAGTTSNVHDCSDGGLAIALAEMAMASGIGATISQPDSQDLTASFFGENQGRYILTIAPENLSKIVEQANCLDIAIQQIGTTGSDALKLGDARAISIADLTNAHEAWFPQFMQKL